ncbi:MAG: GAF domain-containing protein [Anaerolineales bacterium]|nr:GAF domain-containing protein [Anaerolineales bacterium]
MFQTGADAVDIFVINKNTNLPIYITGSGFGEKPAFAFQVDCWKGLVWRVIQKRDLVCLPNIWIDSASLVRRTAFEHYNFISYQGIPLANNGKILGVLEAFHCQEFSPDLAWFNNFRSLSDQVSQILDLS